MQGKKQYLDKEVTRFRLSKRVPPHNLYRRLAEVVDWTFLYDETRRLYSHTGQPSLDPVVFFKLVLMGRLENLASDRRSMEHCALRLDILLFLGYEVDEDLPWHSTVSRIRQLFPAAVFERLFDHVFGQCVAQGLVATGKPSTRPRSRPMRPWKACWKRNRWRPLPPRSLLRANPPPCPCCRPRPRCFRPLPISCAAKPHGKPSAIPNRGPWAHSTKKPVW